ncbi:MAG: 16S rRNA (adenine(1518)-N(6)/adenine(1519)-N(6))-dimethyltransferase RsmA [Candidatus Falkowbacteria bacterium]
MSDLLPQIREICRLFEIKPARSKGQNFLINERIYDEIVSTAELSGTETVIEIGPGLGFLTFKIAQKVKRLLAVELDDQLANYLQIGIDAQDINNVEIINEDILKFNLDANINPKSKYKIVANLPYNISSIFLRLFLSGKHKPETMVLMLQKEVCERIVAAPPEMSLLALSVQYYAEAEIIREVKAGNFWPEPKVDSALIKLTIKKEARLQGKDQAGEDKLFFRLAKMGFSAKRKMLKNNLAGGLKIEQKIILDILTKNKFNPLLRAEDLKLEDWLKLFAALRKFMV